MNPPIKYNTVYFFLLWLFLLLLINPNNIIPFSQKKIIIYSIIGIVICIIAWISDECVLWKAKKHMSTFMADEDDMWVQKILDWRYRVLWILVAILLIILFIFVIS